MSFKLGLTPSSGDEYTLSYSKQRGEKGQPPSTNEQFARYWQWPEWDKKSLYFISRTALTEHEILRGRLYMDDFDNEMRMYKDDSYSQMRGKPSIYKDDTYGGGLELESLRFDNHALRLTLQGKVDKHKSYDGSFKSAYFKDTLSTLGIEDSISLGDATTLSLGYAWHRLSPDHLHKDDPKAKGDYTLPRSSDAHNLQAGVFHDLSESVRLYATVAGKTRLPTLKDRYSQRFGRYVENPKLAEEKSINYEIGYQSQPWKGAQAEAAVFHNAVTDKITSVNLFGPGRCDVGNECQMQNIGKVDITGLELSLNTELGSQWEVGANLTWMDLDNRTDDRRITDVPSLKLAAHALWRPQEQIELVAYAEHDRGRYWSDDNKLDSFTRLDVKGVWHPLPAISAELGVNNVTDKNYELDIDLPSAGRMWFANLRYSF